MTAEVLLAGETWITWSVGIKGFSSYTTSGYEQGHEPLVAALEAEGHRVTVIPNHLAVDDFPWNSEQLNAYDAVILSDIPADTLQLHPSCFAKGQRIPDRLRVLDSWVTAGGGLLMVGGYMSFSGFEGKARYQATALADTLPVTMLGFDDRVEAPDGVTPEVTGGHPALAAQATEWPHFLGYNRFTAKPEAEVVMSVAADPFLVVGSRGRGRVAAFASDCSPHWGSPEFLSWDGYRPFWGTLVDWLGAG